MVRNTALHGWSRDIFSRVFRDLIPCVTTKDFHSVIKHVNTLKFCQTLAKCILFSVLLGRCLNLYGITIMSYINCKCFFNCNGLIFHWISFIGETKEISVDLNIEIYRFQSCFFCPLLFRLTYLWNRRILRRLWLYGL